MKLRGKVVLALTALAVGLATVGSPRAWPQAEVRRTIRIIVQVRDETGNPLRGPTKLRLERVDGTPVGVVETDYEGRFQFENAPRANLTIVVVRDGYVTAREQLGLRTLLREIFVTISLSPSATLKQQAGGPPVVGADYLAIPEAARREYERGVDKSRKGDYERAAKHLENATERYGDSPFLWSELGSVYGQMRDADRAERAFRKALESNKDFAPALFNLGKLYNAQQKFREAEALLARFTELESRRWEGFVELGNARLSLAQYQKAEADYRRARELNPQIPPEIHVKLSNAYVALGELRKARDELETYVRLDPQGALAARAREVLGKLKAQGLAGDPP